LNLKNKLLNFLILIDIKKIKSLTWEEVFKFWHDNEGSSENWKNAAKKRGFSTWAKWRLQSYAQPLGLETASWGYYEIVKPAEVIAGFFGGPFRTWVEKYYDNEKTNPPTSRLLGTTARRRRISELVKVPEIREHQGIQAMEENFPKNNIIICLRHKGEIYVIEGMHRACALGLMNEEKNYSIKKMHFAIGESNIKTLPIVGHNMLDKNKSLV